MSDRLRGMLGRPVHELPRRSVFIACALVIVAGALALSRLGDRGVPHHPTRHGVQGGQAAEPATHEVSNPPVVSHTSNPYDLPSEERQSPAPVTRAGVEQVREASRVFLDGYLRYLYGQLDPDQVPGATAGLRARLADRRPRVPAGVRRRHARVEELQTDGVGELRALVLATVNDRVTRYSVTVVLQRTAPRGPWVATDVLP